MEHSSEQKRFWPNFREAIRRNFRRESLDRFSVRADATGLHVFVDSYRWPGRIDHWSIPWNEIVVLTAFKTDDFSHDTIWVSILLEGEEYVTAAFPEDSDG